MTYKGWYAIKPNQPTIFKMNYEKCQLLLQKAKTFSLSIIF